MQDQSRADGPKASRERAAGAATARVASLMLVLGLALTFAPIRPLAAQEAPPAAETAPPAGNSPAGNPPAGQQQTPPAAGADEAGPAGASESRAADDDEDEFRPSEEVLPEDQVVFPVDI